MDHRMKSQEKSLRIYDEMHMLKKNEQNNYHKLFEQ